MDNNNKQNTSQQTINRLTNRFGIPSVYITEFLFEQEGSVDTLVARQVVVNRANKAVKFLKWCAEQIVEACPGNNIQDVYELIIKNRNICRFCLTQRQNGFQSYLTQQKQLTPCNINTILHGMDPNFNLAVYMSSHEPWR